MVMSSSSVQSAAVLKRDSGSDNVGLSIDQKSQTIGGFLRAAKVDSYDDLAANMADGVYGVGAVVVVKNPAGPEFVIGQGENNDDGGIVITQNRGSVGVDQYYAKRNASKVLKASWFAKNSNNDCSSEFDKIEDFINLNLDFTELELDGVFYIDLTKSRDNTALRVIRDDFIVRGGKIVAYPANYGEGISIGEHKSYGGINLEGSRCSVKDVDFDGNSQFTQTRLDGDNAHYWWNPVTMLVDTLGVSGKNNSVIGCSYFGGSGWPFRGINQTDGVISSCKVEHSQGIGFDGSVGCVVAGNVSSNAHDAHYGAWNSDISVISGNTANGSDNGSGVDCSGSRNCVISSNAINNCANRGVWILQDEATGNVSEHVTIIGNTFENNNTYEFISERGDIHVGSVDVTTDARGSDTVDVDGCVIQGNVFLTSAGANSITLGKYADNVGIDGNVFKDYLGADAARSLMLFNSKTVRIGKNQDLIFKRSGEGPKVLGGGEVFIDSFEVPLNDEFSSGVLEVVQRNFEKDTTIRPNAKNKYQIEERYGKSVFSCNVELSSSAKDIAEISFLSGGFEVADIEIIVCANGDKGVSKKHVTIQGYAGGVPYEIVPASEVYASSSAPDISFVATTGKVVLSVLSTGNVEAAVYIEVVGMAAKNINPLI